MINATNENRYEQCVCPIRFHDILSQPIKCNSTYHSNNQISRHNSFNQWNFSRHSSFNQSNFTTVHSTKQISSHKISSNQNQNK